MLFTWPVLNSQNCHILNNSGIYKYVNNVHVNIVNTTDIFDGTQKILIPSSPGLGFWRFIYVAVHHRRVYEFVMTRHVVTWRKTTQQDKCSQVVKNTSWKAFQGFQLWKFKTQIKLAFWKASVFYCDSRASSFGICKQALLLYLWRVDLSPIWIAVKVTFTKG